MPPVFRPCVVALVFLAGALTAAAQRIEYPQTPRGDQVDVYHGVKVADPYRWLEADVRSSPEVADWVAAENKLTAAYLAAIPERDRIRRRLTELWNFAQYSSPMKEGGRYYYLKNDGLQNQSVLYVMDSLDGKPRALVGSQPVVQGRHDRPDGPGLQRRRPVHGLRPRRGRLGLVHLARHGNRQRATAARRVEMDQVLQRLVDQGRQGIFLYPLRRARPGPSSRP